MLCRADHSSRKVGIFMLHQRCAAFCNRRTLRLGGVPQSSGVPRNFVRGGSRNPVEDRGQRERESGGGSPLIRVSGGRCNLVQEISFHIVKFS